MSRPPKKPYAEVIGDPIAQSKSPAIHNYWIGKLGLDAEYRTCHVTNEGLAEYFAARRGDSDWRGCNVTIPHKEKVAPFLDQVDERALAVGAVNTIYRGAADMLIGTNTDVDGVAASIGASEWGFSDVCIIGAGGAARAAFHLLAGKPCAVRILVRNPDKALAAAKSCGLSATAVRLAPGSAAIPDADLLINATQLGMQGQEPMPDFVLAELAGLASDALVFDMVYAPLETELLKAARHLGLRTSDGLVMLIGQAALAFEKFFGVSPPREDGDVELRKLLTG